MKPSANMWGRPPPPVILAKMAAKVWPYTDYGRALTGRWRSKEWIWTCPQENYLSSWDPAGSGKSVLLKHIIGLESADEGEILIGRRIDPAPRASGIAHRMAMVFQSGALLNSLTVGENVALYLSEHQTQGTG